ncbi:uncharacterized protein N7483_003514 [Penicillium malachiteum]|uniref:uncharacterized protein n=1 Tax=Penicillium malachiteum TaxID=1324776 RepID=UPI0025495238|nr:uncharacterized protein N7483_003514 [Penicillium malachiteum]KAJ5729006.1 hypothetical protein N7483_003514 [Penicillium malachiteum]
MFYNTVTHLPGEQPGLHPSTGVDDATANGRKETAKKALTGQPRKTSFDEDMSIRPEQGEEFSAELHSLATKDGLRVIGYLPNDQNLLLGNTSQQLEGTSSEIRNALGLLPPKPYTDILVQRFLEVTNYNYSCLYPPRFSVAYAAWWADRANGKLITPEFTCLLIRVCACSAQYLDTDTERKLESELGYSAQKLSENLHYAGKQLSNTIGPGKGGLSQVQQLFLTAAWFKSESLFVESWHALSSSIHEAQEQGMHKSSVKSGLSEFDTEMRRRMWCILCNWDWQIAMLLSRPLIINHNSSAVELPNLQLERSNGEGPPSPFAHVSLQFQLGQIMTGTSLLNGGETTPLEAESIRTHINNWIVSLPPPYSESDPDTQWDKTHIYIPLQRHHLYAISYMTMLSPFKRFLTRVYDSSSSREDRACRSKAVDIAIHLLKLSRQLFDHVFPINAKFHIVSFLLFDTAAFLCSAVIHDRDNSLPRRDEVIQVIRLACSSMEELSQITKLGAVCYKVMIKLSGSLLKSPKTTSQVNATGNYSSEAIDYNDFSPDLAAPSLTDDISPESWIPSLDSFDSTQTFFPASLDFPIPELEIPPSMGVCDFSAFDFGQFDQIWDWQNLDLTLLPSMQVPGDDR